MTERDNSLNVAWDKFKAMARDYYAHFGGEEMRRNLSGERRIVSDEETRKFYDFNVVLRAENSIITSTYRYSVDSDDKDLSADERLDDIVGEASRGEK